MGGLILSVDIVFARGADDLDGLSEVIREYLSFTADQYREISSIEIDAEAYLKKTFRKSFRTIHRAGDFYSRVRANV